MYINHPSAIKSMSNETLVEAYQLATQNNLGKDFISLLGSELKERGFLD